MCRIYGLINTLLGLILISGTTAAFRFPNEGRGRSMPRTGLVAPPPPPPQPPRGIRHFSSGHLQLQRRPPVPPTTTFSRSRGRYWPQPVQHQITSRNNFRFPTQQLQLSHPRPQLVTSRHPRQHPQPRALQWEPPVQTLQQAMGYDGRRQAASNPIRHTVPRPSTSAESSVGQSSQPTTGPASPSNNPPSHILPIDEAKDICQRCEFLNLMTSSACCSGYSLCCHQSIPQHSQNQFQLQPQQNYHPQQGPQMGPAKFYQQRNSQQQGQSRVPAHHIFNTDNVNIYNTYDSQFNPENVEPPYDFRNPDYEDLDYPDGEFPTETDSIQAEFDSTRDRRSSLGDLVGGAVISMVSLAVRMAARGGLDDGDLENRGPQHRMLG